jgi:hypothetical protein
VSARIPMNGIKHIWNKWAMAEMFRMPELLDKYTM